MLKQYYDLKIKELEEELQRTAAQIVPAKKFTIIDKIFRRRAIKEYKQRYDEEASVVEKKCREIKEKIKGIEKDKTSKTISKGTIKEIIELAKEGKISYEMNPGDEKIAEEMHEDYKYQMDKNPSFKGLDDFLLVHKTSFLPINDTIRTPKSTKAKRKTEFTYKGRTFSIDTPVTNDSTHFAINGPVSSHFYGDWDDRKYAIVGNFADVDREGLINIDLEDTYFEGDVHFKKTYFILMPKEEYEKSKSMILKANPKAIIVPYEGMSLDEATETLIACLGKRPEQITSNDGWICRYKDEGIRDEAKKILSQYEKGPKYEATKHKYSKNFKKRSYEERALTMIAIYEFLKSNGENPTVEELMKIAKSLRLPLESQNCEKKEILYEYYIKILEDKGYKIPEKVLLDPRFQEDLHKIGDSYISVADEYFCKALIGGKEEKVISNEKNNLNKKDETELEQ